MPLSNNQEAEFYTGTYAIKTTGALSLEWDLDDTGFTAIDDAVFAGAVQKQITLPNCKIKVVNAGANTITFARLPN